MNKTNKHILSGLAAAVVACAFSQAALALDVAGNAQATVIAPLGANEVDTLDFGNVAGVVGSTSTVTVTNAGVFSVGGGAYHETGTGSQGTFDVYGDTGLTYSVSVPGNGVVSIDDAGAGVPMPVNNFSSSVTTGGVIDGTTPDGAADFGVGAELTIGDGQLNGTYTGTYTVTVNYE